MGQAGRKLSYGNHLLDVYKRQVLQMEPLENAAKEVSLKDASLELSDVTFSYDGKSLSLIHI